MTVIESQLEAIAASLGPSMAIFDGQIVVVVGLWGLSMALDENQFRSLLRHSGPGMAILDGQVEVATIS